MKKILTVIAVVAMIFCQFSNTYALEASDITFSRSADVKELLNSPDVEVEIYETIDEYIEAIEEDEYLIDSDKEQMIAEAKEESKSRAIYYEYMKLRFDVPVTSSYHCYPYFYIKWKFSDGSPSPMAMVEVKNANIDRNYNGVSKQFSGTLYYNLESENRLYWDLNGDFYNNGTTTVGGGGKIDLTESFTLNFSVSYSSSHYKYINYDKTYTF